MRERKFDLLRIVAMLMIICHHCIVNDFGLQKELRENATVLTIRQIIIYSFLNSLFIIGVNLFFLLSGYFSIHFSFKKIIGIVLKVYIVFGIVTCIGIITNNVPVNYSTVKYLLDPLDTYWYMMTYLLLVCVAPLLNIITENITENQFYYFFIGVMLICCGYGFLLDINLHIERGYSFLMAMVLYITGSGLRKFKVKKNVNIGVYLLLAVINTIGVILVYRMNNSEMAWCLFSYNNPLIYLESIIVLLWFIRFSSMQKITILSTLAKSTMMVYLLHSTCWLTKLRSFPIFWMCEYNWGLAILLLPIYAVFIYLLCFFIDLIFEQTIGNIIKWVATKVTDRIWVKKV